MDSNIDINNKVLILIKKWNDIINYKLVISNNLEVVNYKLFISLLNLEVEQRKVLKVRK